MLLLIHSRVADYAKWKPIFDERQSTRTEHGATRHWVYRSADDPNEIVVSIQFPNADSARGFAQDPALREAMSKAGVQGQPHFAFLEDVEEVTY